MTAFVQRRTNLQLIVRDRFQGNQTAAAREAGVHPNHFNCLVSENVKAVRNLGETLARKIEQGLALEAGWLDMPHDTLHDPKRAATMIPSVDVPSWLNKTLRTPDCEGVIVTPAWAEAATLQGLSFERLRLAIVTSPELKDDGVPVDSRVVIDTTGDCQSVTSDGVFILTPKPEGRKRVDLAQRSFYLRRITHDPIAKSWSVIGQGITNRLSDGQMAEWEFFARVVALAPLPTVL